MKNKHTPLLINPFLNMAVGIKVRSVPFNKKKKKANEARNSKYLKKSVKKIKIIRKNKNMLHYEWSQGKENKQTPTNTLANFKPVPLTYSVAWH